MLGRPAMRNSLIAMVLVAVATSVAVAVAPSPAGAQGGFDQVTLNPDPPTVWEPFSVEIEASGCEPDAPVSFSAHIEQFDTDVIWFTEMGSVDATADGTGAVSASIDLPVAYPGDWSVRMDSGCDATPDLQMSEFSIARPDDLALTASTDADLQFGKPFSLHVDGTGCPGSSVEWEFGNWVYPLAGHTAAEGVVTPVDGSWSADATGTLPTEIDLPGGSPDDLLVIGSCVFADGVQIPIAGASLPVLPAEDTTTTTTDPGIVSTPRYTG